MGQMRPLRSALAPADTSFATTMDPQDASSPASLKILHILRAPLGGLFRHVIDLVQGQARRGHQIGLFIDSTTGGARAETILAELAPSLALGFERTAIPRELNPRDVYALHRVSRRIAALKPDVLHGHGAKGAAGAEFRPCHPRLYASRRLAGLLPRHHQRRLLSFRRAGFEPAHRSLPVR